MVGVAQALQRHRAGLVVTVGFQLPKTNARIVFDPPSRYHGAEVVMNLDITMDDALRLGAIDPDDAELVMKAMDDLLVEWNLEHDDGTPRPLSVLPLPFPFVQELFAGMQRAMQEVVAVPAPLGPTSNDGATSASPS